MGGVVDGISNAISGGINAIEDLGKGDIGGAITSGLGAVANGIMATNPELSMVSSLGGILGGLTGMGGSSSPGAAGGLPGIFGGLGGALGGLLQNPLGGLGNLLGGGSGIGGGGSLGSLSNLLGGNATPGGLTSGGTGGAQSQIENSLMGSAAQQLQTAQFQIAYQQLTSLIDMLKTCGKDAASKIA
ncbi:MAG TPA: hypothetical protein VJQ82_10440 [Terriglobales bacterium]|nr:hypothetical protein [Terriglobales bacterium]